MSVYLQVQEAVQIVDRLLRALMDGMPSSGQAGSTLRKLVGSLHDLSEQSINNGTIGTDVLACFDAAFMAGATVKNMDTVRIAMLAETPQYDVGATVVSNALIFTLVEQSKIIINTTFISRRDADAMLQKMIEIIDEVKLAVSDLLDGYNYQGLVALCAAIVQHLVVTERQLPRIVEYNLAANLPSLRIAAYLYNDATRSDEVIAENKIVHPAFCPRDIVALSE
jgi:prophage DNA circulation protein